MIEEPEIDRNHVVDKNEIAHLRPGSIATVIGEELDFPLRLELVELVKRDTGHAALVLLLRSIDVEVAKAHHLAGLADNRMAKISATLAPHALVKQQFGVTVNI